MEQLSNTIVIKVGTDSLKNPNIDVMQRIVSQIAELRAQGRDVILVSSGAVGRGLAHFSPEVAYQVRERREALASLGQAKLMRDWEERFAEHSMTTAQGLVEEDHNLDSVRCCNHLREVLRDFRYFETLSSERIVPIFNGNDFVTHSAMASDNDKVAGRLSEIFSARDLVLLTNVQGLFTGNPELDSSEVIRQVDVTRDQIMHCISDGKSEGGTGGMRSKAAEGMRLPRQGTDVYIADGSREDSILGALAKTHGTWFHA